MKKLYILSFVFLFTAFGSGAFANVTFFEHSNYEGSCLAISSDWSYSDDIRWNDKISSISIPHGWEVVIYEHNWGGRSMTLTSDWTVDRWDDFWNDRISSIQVIPPSNEQCIHDDFGYGYATGVTVFEHSNFEGAARLIEQNFTTSYGRYWNDKISSISVPDGWSVVLYEHERFGGQSFTIHSDWTVNAWNDYWNDRISSIEVIPPTNSYGFQDGSY